MKTALVAKMVGALCICPPIAYVAVSAPTKSVARHYVAKKIHQLGDRIEAAATPPCVVIAESAGGLGDGQIFTSAQEFGNIGDGTNLGDEMNSDWSLYPIGNDSKLFSPGNGGFGVAGGDFVGRGSGSGGGVISVPLVAPVPSGAVPEPAVWASLIIGFSVVGVMLRRQRSIEAAYTDL